MLLTIIRGSAPALLSVTLVIGLTACGSDGDPGSSASGSPDGSSQPVRLVASTDVWGDVARQVAGDAAEITSIISDPSVDPHSYEADARTQLKLSQADVVIENGGGYDDFVGTMLDAAGNDDAVVIDAVQVSGRGAPAGGELNEHVWYDFPTVAKVADAVATALGRARSDQAQRFTANAQTFSAAVTGLERQEATLKESYAGTGVAVTEPVPGYMLEACGLVDKTPEDFSEAIEEGTDVPARVLKQTLGLFGTGEVDLLVYNEQTTSPQTEQVQARAEATGTPVVPVTETLPDGKDYLSWMRSNLQAVGTALGR